MTTSSKSEPFMVRFPARPGYLRLSRLNAATFASGLGFDVDALDDLRLAVDEAVTWLLRDEDAGGSVQLELSEVAGGLHLVGRRIASTLPDRPLDDLVHAIFGATTDSYDTATESGERRVTLTKSLDPTVAAS